MKTKNNIIAALAFQFILGMYFSSSAFGISEVPVNQSVQFFSTTANAIEWQWDFGDGTRVEGIANPLHTFTTPGTYKVTFRASNGTCTDFHEQLIEAVPKAKPDESPGLNASHLDIFPNPTVDFISLTLYDNMDSNYEVSIFDQAGKRVFVQNVETANGKILEQLSVVELPAGVYFVNLKGKTETYSVKFLKK